MHFANLVLQKNLMSYNPSAIRFEIIHRRSLICSDSIQDLSTLGQCESNTHSVEIAPPILNFDIFPRLLLCDVILCHGAGQPHNPEDKEPVYYQPLWNHTSSVSVTFSTVSNKSVNFSTLALAAQMVKHLPAMQETRVPSLGWEDPLEKEMTTHSSILAWKIPTDRGAWQPIVHGVAKSQTQLSDFTFTFIVKQAVSDDYAQLQSNVSDVSVC